MSLAGMIGAAMFEVLHDHVVGTVGYNVRQKASHAVRKASRRLTNASISDIPKEWVCDHYCM